MGLKKETTREQYKKLQNGSDVRGFALSAPDEPQNLFPDIARNIGAAFVFWLVERTGKPAEKLRIGIGHDSRLTAYALTAGAAAGVLEEGSSVCFCGLATTPSMFQSTVEEESSFDGAIMITASHLPYNRNGLKFFTKDGGLSKNSIEEILELASVRAEAAGPVLISLEEMEMAVREMEASLKNGQGFEKNQEISRRMSGDLYTYRLVDAYSSHMKQIICREVGVEEKDQPLKGLHIVVDAGNGASGFFATKILKPLGADIEGSVFLEPDGMFPNHVPNPENPDAMAAISKAVLEAKADLGVIFDCDGDRAAVVFSDGREVNRNALIALISAIVKKDHPGSIIVTDSVTSDELTVFLEKDLGLKHFRYRRGYKNVIDRAAGLGADGEDCQLAMETSGHGALKENYFSDDGAYLCVKIISEMARLQKEGRRIEDLIAGLGEPAEAMELRFRILEDDFRGYGRRVLDDFAAFAKKEGWKLVEPNYEGVRLAFDDAEVKGWLLLRSSLHDPALPMNLESARKGGIDVLLGRIRPFFKDYERLGLPEQLTT